MGTRQLDERGIEILYQCLECSHCLTWCLPEIDIADIVEHRRAELVKEDRQPAALDSLVANIIEHHNPFGEPHASRKDWIKVESKEGRRIAYFTGCITKGDVKRLLGLTGEQAKKVIKSWKLWDEGNRSCGLTRNPFTEEWALGKENDSEG